MTITIEGRREAYDPGDIDNTMTVGELIECLRQFDAESPVILNNDNGYTYGSITWSSFEEIYDEDLEWRD